MLTIENFIAELYDRAAGSGLAQRAARRQAAPHPYNSICYLASLAATASGGLRRPPRFASAAYDCGTHVGSPPASPAAGPQSTPLVGRVAKGVVECRLPHSDRCRRGAGPPSALLRGSCAVGFTIVS